MANVVFTFTASPDGGFPGGLVTNLRAYNGYTYVGYIDGSPGNLELRAIADNSVTASAVVQLAPQSDWLEIDWHDSPALLVRNSDKRLLTAVCRHSFGANMYVGLTTNPLTSDPTMSGGFPTGSDIGATLGGSEFTYPQLHQLTSETNDPIYLFWRSYVGGKSTLLYSKTNDAGGAMSWASRTAVFSQNTEAYWNICSNGTNRLDFIVCDGTAAGDHANAYHFYYDGTWHKSDGTSLTLPLGSSNLTQIYSGATKGVRAISQVARVGSEIATVFPVHNGTDEDYVYARFDGSAWTSHTVASSVLAAGSYPWIEGGIAIDPRNLDRLLVSKLVSGTWRIFEYTTTDGGASWTSTQLTSTGNDEIYPAFVPDYVDGMQAVWLKGTASSYTSFAFGIQALDDDAETVDPDDDPYIPPGPSNAVVEIYATSPGSSRWGVALWGVGVWSSAGWIDVTPQSVDATVRWGSHSPQAGILTETEAATWIVNTYDPERLLDPGNTDSPYATDLRAGLPIRIRHRGTIVRQGIAEKIAYFHADKQGGIRVTDNLSLYARTPVPSDSVLSDTLRARTRDAIAAAGLPVMVEPDPPAGDPLLAPQLTGDRSVWRHIADAAQQVLHVAYIDRLGTVRFRPWATPYDRGRGVDETMLVDLGTIVSTSGLYSVVQAQQTIADGDALIERRATPVPRYGPVTYSRTDATPDAGAWADAVLADRALQTLQWVPGQIYPLTATDVEYFATVQAMERFGVQDAEADPAVGVTGIIVGGTFTVIAKRDDEAIWSFELELAQTADTPLYGSEDPLEFVSSSAGDEYVYPS